jgi:DNA repair protein RadA
VIDRKAASPSNVKNDINDNNVGRKNDEVTDTPTITTTNTVSETSSLIPELEVQDIEGISPTTAKKLKDAGIVSPMALAVASAEEIAMAINISKESAAEFVIAAQELLRDSEIIEKEFVIANVALEKRQLILRCSTGSKALNDLLFGGIETQAVTEFCGEFGSGKSQICHTLCAIATQPIGSGGLDGSVIYIDTEGTFRPERLEQIARARGLDHRQVLRSVSVCKIYNSSHLELIIKDLDKYINEFKAKLVIIDSIISLHRAEFVGIGTLADRQQRLNGMLQKLIRVAEKFNIAVVITNQVLSTPDTFFGDPRKAAGGNVLGHSSTYRIYLRKSGESRVVKMMDSPYQAYSNARFTLNEKGTDDIDELKKTTVSSKRGSITASNGEEK